MLFIKQTRNSESNSNSISERLDVYLCEKEVVARNANDFLT
jgi:hypothetical protein